jgi:phosphoribosylformylglycinamidine (FGAM) synthase PurS component
MQVTEQTTQQIERSIKKIAQKLPANEETSLLTDIHLLVSQDSGELIAYDDNDQEITRCVVEQWIDNKDERFYDEVTAILRKELHQMHEVVDNLGIMKPYSFVLENDDREAVAELYVADDDTIILGGDLMEGLDQDLDSFFDSLMKG